MEGKPTDNAYNLLPTQRARDLRNNATLAERKLWAALSNRQLGGVRFNRQVVIKPYICDLVARSAKLVIEVDGGQHGEAAGYDSARTAYLKAKGYRVLRFWNNEIMHNLDGVVRTIEEALKSPPPARAGGETATPSARAGGEEARSAEGEGLLSSSTRPPPVGSTDSTPPAPAEGEQKR